MKKQKYHICFVNSYDPSEQRLIVVETLRSKDKILAMIYNAMNYSRYNETGMSEWEYITSMFKKYHIHWRDANYITIYM